MRLLVPFLLASALLFLAVPVQAACTESEVRECITAGDCNGLQECISNAWSECALDGNTCSPGEAQPCAPLVNGMECPLVEGLSLCSDCGDSWEECVPVWEAECCPGQTQQCEADFECEGTQVCRDGNWGECIFEEICEPRAKRECVPVIDGMECPAVEGTQTCNFCGSAWRECSTRARCCPGQARSCDGNGSQECETGGKWGSCYDGQSCQGRNCTTDNNCAIPRCAMGRCVEEHMPGCCNSDDDCDSTEKCADGNCAAMECGECYFVREHFCSPLKKGGVCCNEHWNPKYNSCGLEYSETEGIVESTGDARAVILFDKGIAAMGEGLLPLAEEYFATAELSTAIYGSRDDYNDQVLERIDSGFRWIEEALAQHDSKLAGDRAAEVEELLQLRKPGAVTGKGSNGDGIAPPPETPWLLIAGLAVAVVFLVLLLIVELLKRKRGFFSIGEKQAKE